MLDTKVFLLLDDHQVFSYEMGVWKCAELLNMVERNVKTTPLLLNTVSPTACPQEQTPLKTPWLNNSFKTDIHT